MTQIALEGFILGLSAGIYCVGACLAFFVPYLLVEGHEKMFENIRKLSLFMLGRLIAYIAFAFIMGFIGISNRNIFTTRFSHVCLVMASSLMLIYSLSHGFRDSAFCGTLIKGFGFARLPFFLGLFTGLNPCPPFLVGAARLWTLNDMFGGVMLFMAFFLGTSVYMIPLIFISYLNKNKRIKQIGLMVSLLTSIWFLFMGMSALMR